MTPRHYMYPLNPKSKTGYRLEDDHGNSFPTSVEGFFECFAHHDAAEWSISKCSSRLKKGDYIWVHFAIPVSAIMAVGRVIDAPHFNKDWDRDAIWIDWDWKLTERLQVNPIPLSAHQQVAYAAVTEANAKTLTVLNRWLKDKKPRKRASIALPVSFKSTLIEQRLGQAAFRHTLLVAYKYRCAVTGCDVRATLQAAHIVPVTSKGQHDIKNGLLLRADIHNLFDRGLLTIDSKYRIQLHESIRNSAPYRQLHGKKIESIPDRLAEKPSLKNLAIHRKSHSQKS